MCCVCVCVRVRACVLCVCVCEKVKMKILLISVKTYSNKIVLAPKVTIRSCLCHSFQIFFLLTPTIKSKVEVAAIRSSQGTKHWHCWYTWAIRKFQEICHKKSKMILGWLSRGEGGGRELKLWWLLGSRLSQKEQTRPVQTVSVNFTMETFEHASLFQWISCCKRVCLIAGGGGWWFVSWDMVKQDWP